MPKNESAPLCCVTSGKGGVGKTSLTINLAYTLALQGNKVLVVDGDLGLANVDVMLGIPVRFTIRDILAQGGDPMDSVAYFVPTLGVLPASSGVMEMVNLGDEEHEQLKEVLEEFAHHFDLILVDTAAGIGPSVLWFNTVADHILVVATPDPTSLTDAYALIKVLCESFQQREFNVIINNVQNMLESKKSFEILKKVTAKYLKLDLNFLGAVPFDPVVRNAIQEQSPFTRLSPMNKASLAIKVLAGKLMALAS